MIIEFVPPLIRIIRLNDTDILTSSAGAVDPDDSDSVRWTPLY